VFVIGGNALNLLLGTGSQLWQVAMNCTIIGLGMGFVASPALIAAQSSVQWGERGVVTAGNIFARNIGSAVGVAVFGAIVNASVGGTDRPSASALAAGIHWVFLALFILSLGVLAAVACMPGRSTPAEVQRPA